MNESEFAELAAGYALHALSPEDERAYLDALRDHPEWQSHADAAAETVVLIAETTPPVAPPPAAREALLAAIAEPSAAPAPDPSAAPEPSRAPTAPPATRAATRARPPARRGWFALAASLAAIVVLAMIGVFVVQQLTPPAAVTALERIESAADAQSTTVEVAGGGEATAHWSVSEGEAVLVTDGIPTVADDETLQLWLVRDGTPISAGLFSADRAGDATALLNADYRAGDVIAVTVEPAGGSPTGAPTSDPIVTITT